MANDYVNKVVIDEVEYDIKIDATKVDYTAPSGGLSATNVKAALDELEVEKQKKLKKGENINISSNNTISAIDTTYTLTQDSTDGHKLTFKPNSGSGVTITIPDNDTKYTAAGSVTSVGTTKSIGVSPAYAREDHVHDISKTTVTRALGYTPPKTDTTYVGSGTITISGSNNTVAVKTATAADLTKLHALTATAEELNYVDGVTSGIQTQFNTINSSISSISSALNDKVEKNANITAATHTKIKYDEKGLVTSGSDLVAADIPDLSGTYALASAMSSKVDKNADITAGTHTKITYDAKGLVTAGEDLAAADIPDLSGTYLAAQKMAYIADSTATDYPTVAEYNALLSALRAAGIMATE